MRGNMTISSLCCVCVIANVHQNAAQISRWLRSCPRSQPVVYWSHLMPHLYMGIYEFCINGTPKIPFCCRAYQLQGLNKATLLICFWKDSDDDRELIFSSRAQYIVKWNFLDFLKLKIVLIFHNFFLYLEEHHEIVCHRLNVLQPPSNTTLITRWKHYLGYQLNFPHKLSSYISRKPLQLRNINHSWDWWISSIAESRNANRMRAVSLMCVERVDCCAQ